MSDTTEPNVMHMKSTVPLVSHRRMKDIERGGITESSAYKQLFMNRSDCGYDAQDFFIHL